ncbi:MAG: hypothetical protein WB341_18615, partial [Terracidiphilus sp.]
MRISFRTIAATALTIGCALAFPAHTYAAQAAHAQSGTSATASANTPFATVPAPDNPVADPKAVVVYGNARFTILTPELIRMEWSADGKFEDHASLVFINRRLPVPKFEVNRSVSGSAVVIDTYLQSPLRDTLTLTYIPTGDGRFTAENLSIELTVDGKSIVWHPGLENPQNLLGTTRTLDTARGSKTEEPIEQGLVSRSGWALVDDSTRPLFDSADFRFLDGEKSPWPWVMERPESEKPGSYTDWY